MTTQAWPYFTEAELRCKCNRPECPGLKVISAFMIRLVSLRRAFGEALPVTSGYRCPAHNNTVAKTGADGPHTTGRAVDIAISGEPVYRLVELAIKCGFTGIGLKQHGPSGARFIHLDDLPLDGAHPRPRVWTY